MSTIDQIVTKPGSQSAAKAKKNLKEFVVRIDQKLSEYFDREIKNSFGVNSGERMLSKEIWEHIKEHNLRPAKRLRGSFIYYGYKLFGGDNEQAILEAAMSIELIHTALLMHDDIMDQDDTRRGKPTTHEHFSEVHKSRNLRHDSDHYGISMAIDIGDIALLAGHEILGRSDFPADIKLKAINSMLRGIINTGFGQAYDITLEEIGEASEQDILDLHYAKTGIYTYENPLQTGAMLALANEKDMALLSEYAVPGGIAFQLQDDILGLFGDSEKTGKPDHSDLRQGKMTLLIIKALEKANNDQFNTLKKLWGEQKISDEEVEIFRKIVIETGSLDYSINLSKDWAKKALLAIPKMKDKGWDKNSIEYLEGIAEYMVEREV